MNKVIISLLLLSYLAKAETVKKPKLIKVAVIDTGIDPSMVGVMCPKGHKDFTHTSLIDTHGHGTHISGLIDQYAKNYIFSENPADDTTREKLLQIKINYCQVILKFFTEKNSGMKNLENTIAAFKEAVKQKVDVINYSGGGTAYFPEEYKAVKNALDNGIIVVAAAGNDGKQYRGIETIYSLITESQYTYYPALYDSRIIVVGNIDRKGQRVPTSNFGTEVDVWELGDKVLSTWIKSQLVFHSGTSQATATHTGKIVRQLLLQ